MVKQVTSQTTRMHSFFYYVSYISFIYRVGSPKKTTTKNKQKPETKKKSLTPPFTSLPSRSHHKHGGYKREYKMKKRREGRRKGETRQGGRSAAAGHRARGVRVPGAAEVAFGELFGAENGCNGPQVDYEKLETVEGTPLIAAARDRPLRPKLCHS